MAAKGMMATDIKGSEDEDVAGGKHVDGIDHLLEKGRKRNKTLIIVSRLRRGNIETWQQREIDNGVRNGRVNAATPFEQDVTDSGCSILTFMNANLPE